MTWFYVCVGCGQCVGYGKEGKGCVEKVKVFGACCYDVIKEVKEISDWREKTGKDRHDDVLPRPSPLTGSVKK